MWFPSRQLLAAIRYGGAIPEFQQWGDVAAPYKETTHLIIVVGSLRVYSLTYDHVYTNTRSDFAHFTSTPNAAAIVDAIIV